MDPEQVAVIASIVESVAMSAALVIAGGWALHRYRLARESQWNLALDAVPSFLPYGDGRWLLSITIRLHNIGRVKLSPSERGCRLSVGILPRDASAGATPHWNDCAPILTEYDVIRNASPNHDQEPIEANYWIEPGGEYQEIVNIVVPAGCLLMTEVDFSGLRGEKLWTYRVWEVPA